MTVNIFKELIKPVLIDWKNYFIYLYEEYYKYRQRKGFKRAKKRADDHAMLRGGRVVYLFHNPDVGYYYGTRDEIRHNLSNKYSSARRILKQDLTNTNRIMPKKKPSIDISSILSRAIYITRGEKKK